MKPPIDAVCFDLDDTLYPYAEYARTGLLAAADHLAERTGVQHHDELLALYFDEGVTEGTFDTLLDRHGLDPGLAGELIEAYHGASAPLDPYPETEDVLATLADDYGLGVITDGRGGHAKLDRLGLADRFDTVVVTPTFDGSKHDADPFERALSDLGVPAGRTMYVGDDPRVDFRVPNLLGMSTVRLRRGRYVELEPESLVSTPDRELSGLYRLPTLLGAGAARAPTDGDARRW